MEAIKLCRLDTPIIFIEARINLSRFVVTGCAAKTSATVTFPSLNLISLFAFCFNIWLNGVASRSEERFSRNAETDLVCRPLLEKKKYADESKMTSPSARTGTITTQLTGAIMHLARNSIGPGHRPAAT